jgi:hypothetical protein
VVSEVYLPPRGMGDCPENLAVGPSMRRGVMLPDGSLTGASLLWPALVEQEEIDQGHVDFSGVARPMARRAGGRVWGALILA